MITNLNDLNYEALRSLVAQRSFSKAGLAVNSTTNTYTVTVGGTVQTGDELNVTVAVDGVAETATFTLTGSETTTTLAATQLEVQVEALTGVTSSAAGAVVTITPTTTTQAIVVTASVTGTDPTTTLTVAQTIIGAKGIKTANTLAFGIDGHTGSKTTTTNIALGGAAIPISSFKWWLVTVDTAGTFTATPGENGKNVLPDIPASQAVVGAVKVATDATHTFTPGVTGLNSTGITDTYYNLSCVPAAGYPA